MSIDRGDGVIIGTGIPVPGTSFWLSGQGVPLTTLGATGDVYYDQSSGNVYQKVDDVTWQFIGNIKGDSGIGFDTGGVTGDVYIKQSDTDFDGAWGQLAHDLLTGLGDDDHSQYHNDVRGDARYYTQAQLDSFLTLKEDTANKGVANGYASLNSGGVIPNEQLPNLAIADYLGNFTDLTTALADAGVMASARGDWLTTDENSGTSYIVVSDSPTVAGDVQEILTPGDVQSVNGQTGVVSLDTDDVNEGSGNLYYTEARVSANTDVAANTAKLAGIEANAKDDQVASEVPFTPAGDITSTDVQAAIEELDSASLTVPGANTEVLKSNGAGEIVSSSTFTEAGGTARLIANSPALAFDIGNPISRGTIQFSKTNDVSNNNIGRLSFVKNSVDNIATIDALTNSDNQGRIEIALDGINIFTLDNSVANGKVLTLDGDLEVTGQVPNGAIRGCLLSTTVATSTTSGLFVDINWNGEDYDTDSLHDNVTNNSRITIPAALNGKRVQLLGNANLRVLSTDPVETFRWDLMTSLNGNSFHAFSPRNTIMITSRAITEFFYLQVLSQPIVVSTGDYFELTSFQDSSNAKSVTGSGTGVYTNFALKVLD